MKAFIIAAVLLSLSLGMPRSGFAQESDSTDNTTDATSDTQPVPDEAPAAAVTSSLPAEDYTGTLADDEDPDNPDYNKRQIENAVFGTDKDSEDFSDEDMPKKSKAQNEIPNTLMRFTFDAQVVFTNEKGEPYMQTNYKTNIESEIVFTNHTWREGTEADITADVIGNLAGNDLFTCKLDITVAPATVNLMTLLKTVQTDATPNGDVQDMQQAAIQIDIAKGYKEDLYSNCSAGESTFNTQGGPEKYNLTVLQNTTPSLNGITIDNFSDSGAQIDIVTDPIEIDDPEMNETITMSGSGTLVLEPLH